MTAPVSTPTFLVCPPTHYEVSYVINPWMHPDDWSREREAWKQKADRQWQAMVAALHAFGWQTTEVAMQAGLPDMVFVADHAFTLEKKAVISSFATPQRAPEAAFLKSWYAANGFEVHDARYMHEGGGDIVYDSHSDIIFLGHGFRSSGLMKGQLEEIFGRRVVPLALRNPNFYHLDTCFCPLKNGWVMLIKSALYAEGLEAVQAIYGEKIIYLDDADAAAFGANAVVVGPNIVMPNVSAALTERLHSLGFTTQQLELDSYIIAGGACRCLTHNLSE